MKITHVKHIDIDKAKWDDVITNSSNHLFYAYSWYLDVVSPNWEALVSEDYLFVMPLPIKKKIFIKYIVQPILTQQLGIFSPKTIDHQIINLFINKIPYLSYEMNLNEENEFPRCPTLPNMILKLDVDYNTIRSTYSKNTIRNIDKAKKHSLSIVESLTINQFIDFINKSTQLYNNKIQTIKELIKAGLKNNIFQLLGTVDEERNLICVLCIAKTRNRITYLLPASNEHGKSKSAMFLLIDHLIKLHSSSNITFDFEGSKVDGIARFYNGFGATLKPYFLIKRCRPIKIKQIHF